MLIEESSLILTINSKIQHTLAKMLRYRYSNLVSCAFAVEKKTVAKCKWIIFNVNFM